MIDDVGAVGDGGLGVDAGGVGAASDGGGGGVACSECVAIDETSFVVGEGFGGCAVYVAIERVALEVGEPYVARVDVGGESLDAGRRVGRRVDLDGVDNPGGRHLEAELRLLRRSAVVPLTRGVGGEVGVMSCVWKMTSAGDDTLSGHALLRLHLAALR